LDLLVVCVMAVIVIACFFPLSQRQHGGHRQLKDSTQIRGIQQSMFLFADSMKSTAYLLPSALDARNATIALLDGASPESKDTTGNIMSVLIFNGFFSPELCVSPAEANDRITHCDNYQYSSPATATDSANALWDPAFNADFTRTDAKGNLSYAHLLPQGPRLKDWSTHADARTPILGNRGPQITNVTKATASSAAPTSPKSGKPGVVRPATKLANSNTLLIHGGRNTWEGNIAFADLHVDFEPSMTPETIEYSDGSRWWRDCLFFDEPDDVTPNRPGQNALLGIFTKAGKSRSDWNAIWD
jgi:prepilin-type processing-associated H-X9-DG protein